MRATSWTVRTAGRLAAAVRRRVAALDRGWRATLLGIAITAGAALAGI